MATELPQPRDRSVLQRLRAAFLAGLLVVVPVGVTIWVLVALVQFLEGAIHLVPNAWQPETVIGRPIPGLGIVLALSTVMICGIAMQSFAGRNIVWLYEAVLLRVPLLSTVYTAVKQLLEQLFSSESGFRDVVLVEWPRPGVYSVGFLTGEAPLVVAEVVSHVSVFIPTTPNFTTGFYAIMPHDEVWVTDLSVEDGFKLLMSAGLVPPPTPLRLPDGQGLPGTLATAGNRLGTPRPATPRRDGDLR